MLPRVPRKASDRLLRVIGSLWKSSICQSRFREEHPICIAMSKHTLQFADQENGDPVEVPGSTVKIVFKRHRRGEAGAPALVFRKGTGQQFSLKPDASADELGELPADSYRCQPYDSKGNRVGKPFYVEVVHLGPDPGDEGGPASEGASIDPMMAKLLDEMRQERQELRGMVKALMGAVQQFAEKALAAQVELAKAMPRVVEASATVINASHGGGLSQAADEIQRIWEAAPEGGSNLETVLNSPVVVGAAAALQKYMAQAAQNGAEAVATNSHGGKGRETMAARAARMAIAANNRAAQAAARG